MWYILAEIGKPIIGHRWVEEGGVVPPGYQPVSDDTMSLINLHGDWLWDGETVIEPVALIPPAPTPLTNEQIELMRQERYRTEADPLYLEAVEAGVRNSTTPDFTAWLAKKDQIRAELPYEEVI
jgi:hypothetical protein